MKQIPLTQGQFALVDDGDYDWLNQFKWYALFHKGLGSFYARRKSPAINGKGKAIIMHRMILNISESKIYVDHINHNTLDNRCENIRIATPAQNAANRRACKDSLSRFKGVSWYKGNNKWGAVILNNNKRFFLGLFEKEADAAKAYDEAAIRLHGEFVYLNFPQNLKLKSAI